MDYVPLPRQLTREMALAIETADMPPASAHPTLIELWQPTWDAAIAAAPQPSKAALDVLAERQRQISVEGWTPKHDDEHNNGELALAAACYALTDEYGVGARPPVLWPWDADWWKPADERRNLVKAGALILAEIERLDRALAQQAPPTTDGR